MPLVDLKTDLTSLKFGNDRPGGGSSRQPFVEGKSLDKRIANDGIETLGRTGGPDLFIRGGFQVASSVADDLVRLGKYFTTVKGGLFVAQQNALSAIGTRIYGGYPTRITGPNAMRLNDGVYTPLSTLAAASGVAFGGHPNKQGTDPTGTSTTLSRPQYLNLVNGNLEGIQVAAFSIKQSKNNRLVNLYNSKIVDINGSTSTELFKYKGGPQGLNTIIKTASNRTQFTGRGGNFTVGYSTFNQNQIAEFTPIKDGSVGNITDFRKSLKFKPSSFITKSPNYSTKNIEQRVNLGNPGSRTADRSNYTKGRSDNASGMDKINSLYLYRSENVTTDQRKNDLVKFRIAIIDNDNPKIKTFVHFRAFINSFNDNMSAKWRSFNYTGRGENFYNYQGFEANYSITFTVMAQSKQELSIQYQKLNYIKSTLAPDYSKEGYMRGNISQLTMGGYLYEMPGIINSFDISIPNDTPWEIGINPAGEFDSTVKELPHRLNVTMGFNPIYKFLPQTVGSGMSKSENEQGIFGARNIKQRFISLEDAGGDANTLYANKISSKFKPGAGTTNDLEDITIGTDGLEEIEEFNFEEEEVELDDFGNTLTALNLFNQVNN